MKRFYKSVNYKPYETGYVVYLDDRILKTPAGSDFIIPNQTLAQQIVKEWEQQNGQIVPDTMPLTGLLNAAFDKVAVFRNDIEQEIIGYSKTDLIGYYANEPEDLQNRQMTAWQPAHMWYKDKFDYIYQTTTQIVAIEQSPKLINAIINDLAQKNIFELTGIVRLVGIFGSFSLGYMVYEGTLPPQDAWTMSIIEELYAIEKWGEDPEQALSFKRKQNDIHNVINFLQLTK